MISAPFQIGIAVAVLAGLWLAVDANGDVSEAKVRAEYAEARRKAVAAAEADGRRRAEASEVVALAEAEKWRAELDAAEAARVELERRLSEKQAKAVCLPASMVEALNR